MELQPGLPAQVRVSTLAVPSIIAGSSVLIDAPAWSWLHVTISSVRPAMGERLR
jgi:hypothetical protein